jgi:hypothetical protein
MERDRDAIARLLAQLANAIQGLAKIVSTLPPGAHAPLFQGVISQMQKLLGQASQANENYIALEALHIELQSLIKVGVESNEMQILTAIQWLLQNEDLLQQTMNDASATQVLVHLSAYFCECIPDLPQRIEEDYVQPMIQRIKALFAQVKTCEVVQNLLQVQILDEQCAAIEVDILKALSGLDLPPNVILCIQELFNLVITSNPLVAVESFVSLCAFVERGQQISDICAPLTKVLELSLPSDRLTQY